MSSPQVPPKTLIAQVVQAQLQNPQAQALVQQQGKALKQVSQQPKEKKSAEPPPDEGGGGKGGLTLEDKRMQADPGDKPKLIEVGVKVSGNHAIDGDLEDLPVVALVAPGVSKGEQRIYAQHGDKYYIMQGTSGKKKRLAFAENLEEAQRESKAGTLQFQGSTTSKEKILAGASSQGEAEQAPSSAPGRKQLQQASRRIALEAGGGNLYVRNNFLITVAGEEYSYLRVPAPKKGTHCAWFFVVSAPSNSTPDSPKAVSGEVLVMSALGAFSVGGSGPAELQWAGGRVSSSGGPAPGTRPLEVADLPALMAAGRIYKMFDTGRRLTLIVDNQYVDDFRLEVKAQARPPATYEQQQMVTQFEQALRGLGSYSRNNALYNAAGDDPATGTIVVDLGRGGVHLTIMAADLQRAIQAEDPDLDWHVFIGNVFAACPYHVSKGTEHWHSAQQSGVSAYLSGKYSDNRVPLEASQLRSAADLDWAYQKVNGYGFTIS